MYFPWVKSIQFFVPNDIDEIVWSDINQAIEIEKSGDFFAAAQFFASVSSKLESYGFKDQMDTEVLYYLCRAWECIDLSQEEKSLTFLNEAKNYYNSVIERLTNPKIKLYISANLLFCDVLTNAIEFDKSDEQDREKKHIPDIKKLFKDIIILYQEGKFRDEEEWAQNMLISLDNGVYKEN